MDKILLENGTGYILLEDGSGDVLLELQVNPFEDDEGGHYSLDIKFRQRQQEEEILISLLVEWLN